MIDIPRLFRRLGRLAGILKSVAYHQDNEIRGNIASLVPEFSSLPSPIAALTRAVRIPAASAGQILSNRNLEILIVDAAQRTLLETMQADQPNESWDIPKAVAEVIRQMKATGATVPACTVAYTVNNSPVFANPGEANNGDGAVLVGLRQPNYVQSDNVFAEQLRLSVTDDAELFNETWVVRGAVPASGLWSFDWPGGSGAVSSLITCDPSGEAGDGDGQTILTDGSFEEWDDSTTPTFWTDVACSRTSTTGTVFNEFPGETRYSVSMVSGGSSPFLASVAQVLDTDLIKASTVYGVSFRFRLSASANFTSFTALTIRAELQDAVTETVLTDVGGNNLRVEKVYSAHSEDWFHISGVWVTPRRLPAAVQLKIFTTDVTITPDGSFATLGYLDHVALVPLKQPYPGGPALAIVGGSRPWREGDSLEVTVTNDRAGALYGYTWQAVWDRFYGNRTNFLYLPTSATPTIPDFYIDDNPPIISPPPPPPPAATGTLAVHVFADTNEDGDQDTGELDIANRSVTIIGPVTRTLTTDSDGDVSFTLLPPGDYAVIISLMEGENWDGQGAEVTVAINATTNVVGDIVAYTDPAPPFWNLTINTNRPFRAVTAVGPTTYNGFTDATGRARFLDIDGPAASVYEITLESNSLETAVWNSYSDPNTDSGTGFVADLTLGAGTATPSSEAVVNYTVGTNEEPIGYGRLLVVVLSNETGLGLSGRDVTLSMLGLGFPVVLTGTTDSFGQVLFESPYIIGGTAAAQVTVESSGVETAVWEFRNQQQQPTESGTGFTGAGTVAGVAGSSYPSGSAYWRISSSASTFTISGTVTVDGSPAARDVSLTGSASSSTTSNGTTGNYSFTGLSAGTYTVAVDLLGGDVSDPVGGEHINIVLGPDAVGKDFVITSSTP